MEVSTASFNWREFSQNNDDYVAMLSEQKQENSENVFEGPTTQQAGMYTNAMTEHCSLPRPPIKFVTGAQHALRGTCQTRDYDEWHNNS